MKIPTRHLNPTQYIVPEKLLQVFLSNYQPARRANAKSSEKEVIKAEVPEVKEGGEAEPVNLSTTFEKEMGTVYSYELDEKVKQDRMPPSAIEIRKVPKKGKIITKTNDGSTRELKVGDIVSTEELKSFKYDQG